MQNLGRYDSDLQMFVEEAHIDLKRLVYLRWLVEHGRLEHDAAGECAGEYSTLIAALIAEVTCES